MNKLTTLPEALATDRQRLGMTQERMAAVLEVPFQSLCKWERGLVAPRDPRLRQLIGYFGAQSQTGLVAQAMLDQRATARKQGTPMHRALEPYMHGKNESTKPVAPASVSSHFTHDHAFAQESEKLFGNEAGMRQGFENKRARLKRQLLLGTANRPMEMEQARMAALEALERFEQASDDLGLAVAWTSVLRDHLLEQNPSLKPQDVDLS